jgi:hypothetical protein
MAKKRESAVSEVADFRRAGKDGYVRSPRLTRVSSGELRMLFESAAVYAEGSSPMRSNVATAIPSQTSSTSRLRWTSRTVHACSTHAMTSSGFRSVFL